MDADNKEKEKPDIIIGLFHSGVDFTYDNQTAETPRNENAAKLVAEQVPGFDIVFPVMIITNGTLKSKY